MIKKNTFIFLLLCCFQLNSIQLVATAHQPIHDYTYNPYIPIDVWDSLKPYFLPMDHPLKNKLDKIFQSERVVASKETFKKAGFKFKEQRGPENLLVAKHSKLKGYMIKAYLDNQSNNEWSNYLRRVTGAQSIQNYITNHGLQKKFRVPKKWIYPLPLNASSKDSPAFRKNFILVVEDMHILENEENAKAFKERITRETLDSLFQIISAEGLLDSVHRSNIPFNQKGQLNFIDTEHHHLWPVPYGRMNVYLSTEMRSYWKTLTNQP